MRSSSRQYASQTGAYRRQKVSGDQKQRKQREGAEEHRLLPFVLQKKFSEPLESIPGYLLHTDEDVRHFLLNHKRPNELSKLGKLETAWWLTSGSPTNDVRGNLWFTGSEQLKKPAHHANPEKKQSLQQSRLLWPYYNAHSSLLQANRVCCFVAFRGKGRDELGLIPADSWTTEAPGLPLIDSITWIRTDFYFLSRNRGC